MVAKIQKESNEGLFGKVFQSSWGYEQTNVCFYQVVALKGKKSVELKKLNYDLEPNGMAGKVTACLDNFKEDETISKRVLFYSDKPLVKIDEHERAYLMDDVTKKCYVSFYA